MTKYEVNMSDLIVVQKSHLNQMKAELEKTEKLYEKIRKLEDLVRTLREEYWRSNNPFPRVVELENKLRAVGEREAEREQELENYKALWSVEQEKNLDNQWRIDALRSTVAQWEQSYRALLEKYTEIKHDSDTLAELKAALRTLSQS